MRAVTAGAVAAHATPALAPVVPRLSRALGVRTRMAEARGVALTFDDGPHPEGTPATLDALAKAGATATFFLVGEQVARRPRLAAEIIAAGHEVALHCHQHRNLLRLTPAQIREDLRRAADTIEAAAGRKPWLYRPPYGIFSWHALALARRRGWTPLLWSRWGRDWARRATPESIASRVTRQLRAGDVLLLHDADFYSAPGSWRRTVAALPAVLAEIDRRGLRTVPVDREHTAGMG